MSSKNSKHRLIRHIFTSTEAEELLKDNNLAEFEQIWRLEAPWFEDPNERRDGVSGVVTWELKLPDGSTQKVFIKRQENHNTLTYRHPLRGEPTFYREFCNIRKLADIGVPTIEALYYGEALCEGKRRAILISRALDEYSCLESWFSDTANCSDPELVNPLLRKLAKVIRPMHEDRVRHGCLYGKHIFVKAIGSDTGHPSFKIKLLDLEKARVTWFKSRAIEKDLSQLMRHTPGFDEERTDLFLSYYFNEAELSSWRPRLKRVIHSRRDRQKQKAGVAA